ncbi:hypothetical protein [Hymenobacter volaticus]|uniref:Uncharacterized protein n=1 Tax=Hymenobacter volaticus TaxID=2932254 RepID=A0ABY4G9M8_9BACT|nr:hypothetical protein [Hymenobacter volaticus]UOQ67456.1 hypothetical protein MUN86_06140 [Hymenobacter volaticus]
MNNKLLLTIFVSSTSLVLADILTPIDINSLEISFLFLSASLISGIVYIGSAVFKWRKSDSLTAIVLIAGLLSLPGIVFVWDGGWKTQSIEYQHRHLSNRVIEFQMMNPGAGSYRRRFVDKIKLVPGISWLREVDANKIDTANWSKVDIDVNDLGLKYP